MKYTVELKYINPSHEHVSLRRRVDTVTRLVEASSEQEAINRAANQQRALGFMIKEASVVKPEVIKEEAEQIDEELDQLSGRFLVSTDPSKQRYLSTERGKKNAAKKNVANLKYYIKHSLGKHPKPNLPEEVEQVDEAGALARKLVPGLGRMQAASRARKQRDLAYHIGREVEPRSARGDTDPKDGYYHPNTEANRRWKWHHRYFKIAKGVNEEAEQIDEQSPAEIKAKYYHDQFDKVKPVKAYDKEGKLVGRYRSMDHAKQMKPGHTYKVEEEVDSVNEDQAADMQKIQSMDKGSMVGGKTELKTHLKYLNAMHTHQKKYGLDTAKTKKKIGDVSRSLVQMGEEAEQVDEAKKTKKEKLKTLLYRNRSNVRKFGKGAGLTTAQKAAARRAIANEEVEQIDEARLTGGNDSKEPNYTSAHDDRQAADFHKKELERLRANPKSYKSHIKYAETMLRRANKKLGIKEEVEQVDEAEREAGYKMSPAVKAAQAKSDALSKVAKRPQAGTLAAQKAKKAADKMVSKAKNNKTVNLEPSIEAGKENA